MMVMVVGVFAAVATNANAADGKVTYKVGYAKVDITPWQDPGNADSYELIPVGTAGYGAGSGYYAGSLVDSNGDGETNRKDGIFATCTVLTEFIGENEKEGKTLVFISMDSCNGYSSFAAEIRETIVPALEKANVNVDIAADHIFVSGSHCHTAPNFGTLSNSAEGSAERTYYDGVVSGITNAVATAYDKKATATMSRITIAVT